MAQGLSNIELIGTCSQDTDLRYTAAGLAILTIDIAGRDEFLSRDGELVTSSWYNRATVFGPYAEALADSLTQGTPVFVSGRLRFSSWATEAGEKRSSIEVIAERIATLEYGARQEPTVEDAKGQPRLTNALNSVTVIGNLTRDAELRYTPNGHAVANLGIAINERYRDREGEMQETVHFVNATAWRDLAEAVAELPKGAPVMLHGRLMNESWTDRDGNARFSRRIVADRAESLARPSNASETAKATPAAKPAKAAAAAKAATAAPARKLDIDEFPPEEDLPF